MRTIEISDELFEYLNSKAIGFELNTPDAVLRKELGIGNIAKPIKSNQVLLRVKGVDFPEGMQLRFKSHPNDTAVVKDGAIIYRGKRFGSPSSAAVEANGGTSTNGWIHWEYLDTAQGKWKLIDTLRTR